jgi:hypothetical protein
MASGSGGARGPRFGEARIPADSDRSAVYVAWQGAPNDWRVTLYPESAQEVSTRSPDLLGRSDGHESTGPVE